MLRKRNILFLHSRLSGYFMACVKRLTELYPVNVHIVRYPVDKKEAPFDLAANKNIEIHDRDQFTGQRLVRQVEQWQPKAIYCSGWHDKGYLKACKAVKKSTPTLLTLDNQWKGTLKQYIANCLGPWYLHRHFTHAWVPGIYQYEYARRLGFAHRQIKTGMYSADVSRFNKQYKQYHPQKRESFPKRFLFVGRYTQTKGLQILWRAFINLKEQGSAGDWELWCAGTGPLEQQFPDHPDIKDLGFQQPDELPEVIEDTGVFVLPSNFEPWGVVVHEFAAAGMPLICSDEVGAATAFLREGDNGYVFPAGEEKALEKVIQQMMGQSPDELVRMGECSHHFAQHINPTRWAHTLGQLIE